ncbi:hypothetical protein ACFQDD_11995 [Halorubrum pallidum]|uniref:Uncharacterized protein n=1 Tax=Halorubrum pallidum TaxID=1526114 RepID=A0ABD5T9M3_9EURY
MNPDEFLTERQREIPLEAVDLGYCEVASRHADRGDPPRRDRQVDLQRDASARRSNGDRRVRRRPPADAGGFDVETARDS